MRYDTARARLLPGIGANARGRRLMRILCYAQNLVGVGHFVRMLAIARGLGATHEVHLVDGGRAVPRRGAPSDPRLVTLPRLIRQDGLLAAEDTGRSVPDVLAERGAQLTEATARIRPQVVLVDHYPFSRWELDKEITDTIAGARRACPEVSVVCSVRDNLWSHFRTTTQDAYEQGVLARLAEWFDRLLIHTDPGFWRLEEAFGRAGEIAVPRHYTGFVVDREATAQSVEPGPEPYAVLSCGGSTKNLTFLLAAIEAFRRLRARGAVGRMPLLVFPGPVGAADHAALRQAIGNEPGRLFGFSPDFPAWLAGCMLSVSRAGYNTCGQILAAGTRSILAPNPENADQAPRAQRLAKLGLATVVEGEPPDAEAIASAVLTALASAPGRHALDLEGVAATRAMLEQPRLVAKAR